MPVVVKDPSKADSILSLPEQRVLRYLIFKSSQDPESSYPGKPYYVNPYQLHKFYKDKAYHAVSPADRHKKSLALDTAQKILGRFAVKGYAIELPPVKFAKGGRPRRNYTPSVQGIHLYLSTMLDNQQELFSLADRYGELLPHTLGPARYFGKENVSDLALRAWTRINPPSPDGWTTNWMMIANVRISLSPLIHSPADQAEVMFHIEARKDLDSDDLHRWNRAIDRKPELKKYTEAIQKRIHQDYNSRAAELGIPVSTKEHLEREDPLHQFWSKAKFIRIEK